jgi:phage gp46-like protein
MAGFTGSEVPPEGPESGGISGHDADILLAATIGDDDVPPVITLLSPLDGNLASLLTPVVLRVTDEALAFVTIKRINAGDVDGTVVYDALGVAASFSGSSASIGGTQADFSVRPSLGWSSDFSLLVTAIDRAGNITTAPFAFVVPALALPPAESVPSGVLLEGIEGAGGDFALVWSDGAADMLLAGDDLASDAGLSTAALLSLVTDRRAEDDDVLPSGDGDRRGWWGDEFAEVEGDRIGSRLWLLDRSAMRGDLIRRGEELVREALVWMLEDRVVERIDVAVETGAKELLFAIALHRPGKDPVAFRYAHVWDSMASFAEGAL